MTGPLILYGGVTNTDPTQLVAPSIAVGVPIDTLTTRTLPVTVAGPASWPGGVSVQLQTQRDAGAWVNSSVTAATANLAFTREAAAYTISVRGYAINGGTLTDSGNSGVITVTIPAALIAVTTGGTPIRFRVRVMPMDVATYGQTAQVATSSIPLRAISPNRVIVDRLEDPEVPVALTPTAVAWQVLTVNDVSLGSGAFTNSGTDWRITITPSASARVLVITVTAADSSITSVRYPITFSS